MAWNYFKIRKALGIRKRVRGRAAPQRLLPAMRHPKRVLAQWKLSPAVYSQSNSCFFCLNMRRRFRFRFRFRFLDPILVSKVPDDSATDRSLRSLGSLHQGLWEAELLLENIATRNIRKFDVLIETSEEDNALMDW
jgi:hypothetical protein